jgi:hypothetical protein
MNILYHGRTNNSLQAWIALLGYAWLAVAIGATQPAQHTTDSSQVTIQLAPPPIDSHSCRPSFLTELVAHHTESPTTKNFLTSLCAKLAQVEKYEQAITTVNRAILNSGASILLPHSFKVNLRI